MATGKSARGRMPAGRVEKCISRCRPRQGHDTIARAFVLLDFSPQLSHPRPSYADFRLLIPSLTLLPSHSFPIHLLSGQTRRLAPRLRSITFLLKCCVAHLPKCTPVRPTLYSLPLVLVSYLPKASSSQLAVNPGTGYHPPHSSRS